MSLHLTIWWLWWTLIGVYGIGVILGMLVTLVADDVWWYLRPLILVWPATFFVLGVWHAGRFMIGKE